MVVCQASVNRHKHIVFMSEGACYDVDGIGRVDGHKWDLVWGKLIRNMSFE